MCFSSSYGNAEKEQFPLTDAVTTPTASFKRLGLQGQD